jgi:two-component system chemotaxis response regulator CheY
MSISIVIVDDAPFILEVYENLLKNSYVQILGSATNGNEAVEIVQKLKPQVVLMDLVMPELNGIEAAKKIIKILPNTKVIACSTLTQEHMIMKALDAGCCDYVTKPFEKQDLLNAIDKAVKNLKEIGL